MCIISKSWVNSNWSYSPETRNSVQNRRVVETPWRPCGVIVMLWLMRAELHFSHLYKSSWHSDSNLATKIGGIIGSNNGSSTMSELLHELWCGFKQMDWTYLNHNITRELPLRADHGGSFTTYIASHWAVVYMDICFRTTIPVLAHRELGTGECQVWVSS